MEENLFDAEELITLTDENGKEEQFAILCVLEHQGTTYYALLPVKPQDGEEDGYVLLKVEEEDGEEILATVDDDDEFNEVADLIDEELNSEIDYDEDEE